MKTPARTALLLFSIALAVRVVVALVTGTHGPPVEDERGYTLLAQSLAPEDRLDAAEDRVDQLPGLLTRDAAVGTVHHVDQVDLVHSPPPHPPTARAERTLATASEV